MKTQAPDTSPDISTPAPAHPAPPRPALLLLTAAALCAATALTAPALAQPTPPPPPTLPTTSPLPTTPTQPSPPPPTTYRFDFGPGATAPGFTQVRAGTPYSAALGHGFDPGALPRETDRGGGDALRGDFVTTGDSGAPFKFSVALPEGNYRVTVTLGDAAGETLTTVKAETGRLMLERIATPAARYETRAFLVNTRDARLSPGNRIKLDVREWDAAAGRAVTATWDDRLTLQFSDARPCLCALEIEPAPDAITIFLIGDSTVTDQGTEPYGTWGQQLPRWFAPPVAIANHAESGQTLKAFRFQRRWDKVMALMKPGDYVFMQFGHNDLNQRGHDAMWPTADKAGDWINTHADAATDYQWLLAAYAVEIKRRGGTPVIVSPMTKIDRRSGQLNTPGLGAYPEAAREASRLAGAAFIDLNAMSEEVVRALGEKAAPLAYVDGLHTNTYGGYLYARCIVEGIRRVLPDLARHLVEDAGEFTPTRPHPLPADYKIPPDPRIELPRPPGFPPRPPAPPRRA